MIDEKKIEYAAIDASIEDTNKGIVRDGYVICSRVDHELGFQDGFKAGINWFLDNLWHDASEEPKDDKTLLIQYHKVGIKNLNFFVLSGEGDSSWCEIAEDFHITRWLYIDDLLKGGK